MRTPPFSATALTLLAAACSLQPAPGTARPPLPLADAVPLLTPDCSRWQDDGWRARGVLDGGGERVRFELRRAAGPATPARPVVLLVPILAGGADLMELVARRICAEGFDVAFCARAGDALLPPQRGPELDELFRRTVLHQRLLLRWLASSPDAPPATFLLGVSLGGMVATVVAAEEPSVHGLAVCFSGGDLPSLMMASSEPIVREWVDWRRTTDGIDGCALDQELRRTLGCEPLRYAARVPTDKVLFVDAGLDTVVPPPNQALLWEAFGRPERLTLPLGHYSAVLGLDRVILATADHFRSLTPPTPPGATAALARRAARPFDLGPPESTIPADSP
ncbi:MAG: dienelactone hydrolase family protein [Planctomycetes bacterium]|nr:dienelactone hydrolase family protein [Planctomycetota bacterium]